MNTNIITHRGLDPDHPGFFKESSLEAFTDHISRGYGLEFDFQLSRDDKLIVMHDSIFSRLTAGKDTRDIRDLDGVEILAKDFEGSHLTTVPNLLKIISETAKPGTISALHLKHHLQTSSCLDLLLKACEGVDYGKFVIFDLTLDTAEYLRRNNPELILAPSVAHLYDVKRYGKAVGNTLYPILEVVRHSNLFQWLWLDEWDRTDEHSRDKTLYNQETFKVAREAGFLIAVVSPELHATSPALLGGEAHQDARTRDGLEKRLKEIIAFKPDAICTDYPDWVKKLCIEI